MSCWPRQRNLHSHLRSRNYFSSLSYHCDRIFSTSGQYDISRPRHLRSHRRRYLNWSRPHVFRNPNPGSNSTATTSEPHILHIDRFGNLITNITRNAFKEGATLVINGKAISTFRKFFGEEVGGAEEPFAICSAGFLEIAVNGRSAAEFLGVKRGDEVHTD